MSETSPKPACPPLCADAPVCETPPEGSVRPEEKKFGMTYQEFRKFYYATYRCGTAGVKAILNAEKVTAAERLERVRAYIERVEAKLDELEYGV